MNKSEFITTIATLVQAENKDWSTKENEYTCK